MERGDISLLSYESSNSSSGMMLQSLGKPSAQQEDDSIKVLEGGGMRAGVGWGGLLSIVLCCSVMAVL